jgi:hypothetical protein
MDEVPVGHFVARLVGLTRDPYRHVRLSAIENLGYASRYARDRKPVLRVLGESMADKDPGVRTKAVSALWEANSSSEHGMALMHHMEAADAKLEKPGISNDDIVAALGRMLDCPVADVKRAAAAGLRWLEKMGADISGFVVRLKAYR